MVLAIWQYNIVIRRHNNEQIVFDKKRVPAILHKYIIFVYATILEHVQQTST